MSKKTYRILIVCLLTSLCVAFLFLGLPQLVLLLLPFLLAWLLAKIIAWPVNFLYEKAHFPRKLASILCMFTAVGAIGYILSRFFGRIFAELNDVIQNSDILLEKISSKYTVFRDTFAARFGLSDFLDRMFAGSGEKLTEYITSNAMSAFKGAYAMVRGVPNAIIFCIVLLLATYFISSDYQKIAAGMRRVMPKSIMDFTSMCTKNMFSALGAYIKAQLLLMCITFFETTLGFLIIGGSVADYALLLAFIISIIDAIPILGTGTVLIPWGVYALLVGDVRLGVMLLVLYLICLAVRQIVEPRLMAQQIGLHPLLMLMVMYTGLRLFGLFGMILGPILALFIKQMYTSGVFRKIGAYINGE